MIVQILTIMSAGALGIFLGAQIAEAMLFVPHWKALNPDDFFELHQSYGKKIHDFFAPLTIVATVLPLINIAFLWTQQGINHTILISMGISTLLFFSTYFIYFKNANLKFAKRSISNEGLKTELVKWGNWHWTRVCFEAIAFVCALILLTNI